jgi:hypothetical protein
MVYLDKSVVICDFKKSQTIWRVLWKPKNFRVVKVENLYLFQKCKSNPEIVETGISTFFPHIAFALPFSNPVNQ